MGARSAAGFYFAVNTIRFIKHFHTTKQDYKTSHAEIYVVTSTMRPSTTAIFEHIGAARLFGQSMRIDIKTMQAVIPASGVTRLMDHWPADVYDISDVMKTSTPAPVGKAWITRSGRAVMYRINGTQYVSPLAQVKGMITGSRKYAGVSVMTGTPAAVFTHATTEGAAAEVET